MSCWWNQRWLAVLVLALATLLAYQPVWKAGFIWDDDAYVTNNKTLQNTTGLKQIWFERSATPQYYPLVHTTFWIEHQLWGLHPLGYHVDNVLLHVLAAILLGQTLLLLRVRGAWLAAAIFALHPVQVESVAWITERKNVLSAVFYFGAALGYLRFAGFAGNGQNARDWPRYLIALLLFTGALLSKTITCSLPAALLLVIWWKRGRLEWRDVFPLLPFFAMGLALGLHTVWLEKHHVGAQGMEWSLAFLERCWVAGRALWFYASKLLWPVNLTFIYPRWEVQSMVWWHWVFPLSSLAIVATLWRLRRRLGRGPLVAALFFAGTLFPALGFFDVYPFRYSFVADHFQYLASVGVIVICAAGLARFPQTVGAVVLLVLGILTWQQARIYQDVETLWRDTLSKNPNCWLAHNNLGLELERAGKMNEALEHYREAQRIEPDFPEAHNNAANMLASQGRLDEAFVNYQRAVRLKPDYADAVNGLGVVLAMRGNYGEARPYFERALQVNSNYIKARVNLANVFRIHEDLDAAIEQYRLALRVSPSNSLLRSNLGQVLQGKGLMDEAMAEFRAAIALAPKDPALHFRLGWALAETGRDAEAREQLEEALRLKPDFSEAARLLEVLRSE